jgi:hypothetical protein
MRLKNFGMLAVVFLAGIWACASTNIATAADGDSLVGIWKGGWEGAGSSGRFDLTFARGSDGKLTASVSVGSDMGDYNAKFSTLKPTGDKFTGAYDYPPDVQGEVTITGSFDPSTATGTWSLAGKGQPNPAMAAGTWKVSKQ